MILSIVIPLYNLEGFIGGCIASTQRQDLPKEVYEVIVVDDGSTDGSLAAARHAAADFANVRVFTKPNGGLGDARNYGLDRAAGRYVLWLDADDRLAPDTLRSVALTLEEDRPEMLCIRIRGVDERGREVPMPTWDAIYDGYARSGEGIVAGRARLADSRIVPMVPSYVFDREFLQRHDLSMAPIWHEDEEFTPRALYHARRWRYLDLPVYLYLQRSDSFTGDYNPDKVLHVVPALERLGAFAARIEAEGDREGAALIRRRIGYLAVVACRRAVRERTHQTRALIRSLRGAGLFPLEIGHRSLKDRLLNISPALFILRCRLHRR